MHPRVPGLKNLGPKNSHLPTNQSTDPQSPHSSTNKEEDMKKWFSVFRKLCWIGACILLYQPCFDAQLNKFFVGENMVPFEWFQSMSTARIAGL